MLIKKSNNIIDEKADTALSALAHLRDTKEAKLITHADAWK